MSHLLKTVKRGEKKATCPKPSARQIRSRRRTSTRWGLAAPWGTRSYRAPSGQQGRGLIGHGQRQWPGPTKSPSTVQHDSDEEGPRASVELNPQVRIRPSDCQVYGDKARQRISRWVEAKTKELHGQTTIAELETSNIALLRVTCRRKSSLRLSLNTVPEARAGGGGPRWGCLVPLRVVSALRTLTGPLHRAVSVICLEERVPGQARPSALLLTRGSRAAVL